MEVATASGARYLETLSDLARRQSGLVYTPPHVVRFVLEVAGFTTADALERWTVLDPACGSGVFLEHAVELVAAHYRDLGWDLCEEPARGVFLDGVASRLFGVDIDAGACSLARKAVRAAVSRATRTEVRAAFFEKNVFCADFLRFPAGNQPQFFDLIVGNPPYVSTETQTLALRDSLRRRFLSAKGRFDLYGLFMEHAIPLLRRGGRLAFITPDKYLLSQSGLKLRELIVRQTKVLTLARFQSHRVFSGAATVPCVTVLERSTGSSSYQLLECSGQPDAYGKVRILARSHHAGAELSGAPWHVKPPELLELARKIAGNHPLLGQVVARLSPGPATGRDCVFIGPAAQFDGVETELLHPVVRGRDIEAFRVVDPGLYALVPYVDSGMATPRLIDLADFPGARRYLERHRGELEKRHAVRVWGKAWYDLHDQVTLDLTVTPKILVPDVARRNRFAHDPGRFLPLHSAYYLIFPQSENLDLAAVLLNSLPLELYMRLHAPMVKDGFSRYRRQFLAALPLPKVSRADASALLRLATEDPAECVDRVRALFGLSESDLSRCREFLDRLGEVHS